MYALVENCVCVMHIWSWSVVFGTDTTGLLCLVLILFVSRLAFSEKKLFVFLQQICVMYAVRVKQVRSIHHIWFELCVWNGRIRWTPPSRLETPGNAGNVCLHWVWMLPLCYHYNPWLGYGLVWFCLCVKTAAVFCRLADINILHFVFLFFSKWLHFNKVASVILPQHYNTHGGLCNCDINIFQLL